MELVQIGVLLLAIQVVWSTGEYKACNLSTIAHEGDENKLWNITGDGCESNIALVVVKIKWTSFISDRNLCVANATVAGINLCYMKRETCIVVMPRFLSFKPQVPSECKFTILTTSDRVIPVKISYMSFLTWTRFNLNYTVYEMAGENKQDVPLLSGHRACDSSPIPPEYLLWQIGVKCKSNITMMVVQITAFNFVDKYWWYCYANATVAGINLCFMEPGTCIVVIPQDRFFKAETPADCSFTIFIIRERVLPIEVTYKSYDSSRTGFGLKYTLYEMVEKEQDATTPGPAVPQTETSQAPKKPCSSISDYSPDATASFATVPYRGTPQDPQKNQSAAQSLAIVFGILFGIVSVAFGFVFYRFMQQKKELSQFYTSATSPSNNATISAKNETNADAVYSQITNANRPNNTSEAEVTVNELYHM